MTLPPNNGRDRASSHAWLQRIGACGSVLALTILGASMLLRLTTVFALDGHAVSTLPADIEYATRLLHRLAASGVAVLALCAVTLCWIRRGSTAQWTKPTAWIVASTVILALIGPLTPGYQFSAITVANVTGGMVLLMAFWWLRESVATQAAMRQPIAAFSWAAIIAFVAHVGTGAAASAWEMHAVRWPAFVHLASLVLCLILIGVIRLEFRRERLLAPWTTALASLLAIQLLVGYLMMWQDSRPLGLTFLHAMLSSLLAMALVSLAVRGSTRFRR